MKWTSLYITLISLYKKQFYKKLRLKPPEIEEFFLKKIQLAEKIRK